MRRIYKELTGDQRKRGVVFSSTLSTERTEQEGDKIHEVFKDDAKRDLTIQRLENDSFFNDSPWTFNIIRK